MLSKFMRPLSTNMKAEGLMAQLIVLIHPSAELEVHTLPNLYVQKYRNVHILHEIQEFLSIHFTGVN